MYLSLYIGLYNSPSRNKSHRDSICSHIAPALGIAKTARSYVETWNVPIATVYDPK
jgi:hypothetical protein